MQDGQRAVLVTGSSSGIGLAIARRFAELGHDVALNSFEPEAAAAAAIETVKRGAKGRVVYLEADLTEAAQSHALAERAIAALGRIDILVNNAGVQRVAPITELDPADWERIVSISLDSSFHTIRAALPGMQARGWGRIINMASAHGLRASPFKSAYVATKHAVVGLTKSVALEVAEQGITVNAVCPGYVWTPLVARQVAEQARVHGISEEEVVRSIFLGPQPTKQFVQPEEIAELCVYLSGDMARSITGTTISIDGGWTAK